MSRCRSREVWLYEKLCVDQGQAWDETRWRRRLVSRNVTHARTPEQSEQGQAQARTTRLLVARHGETRDNAARRWQGWNDSPLTARGVSQAEALGRRLVSEPDPVAALYSSDLGRAVQTATIAGQPLGLSPATDRDLRERHAGEFSGLSLQQLNDRYAADMARRDMGSLLDWTPPGGESLRQVLARVLASLDRVGAAWRGRSVVVVTHGGVIRVLATHVLARDGEGLWDLHAANCGLSAFTWHGEGQLTLERLDEHDYLPQVTDPPAPIAPSE